MNDDLLQEHLSRLEMGEPLETALADLTPDEAELVRTAAALRALPHPARAAGAVHAQRAHLVKTAQRGKTMTSSTSSKRWVWGGLALAGAAAFLILCALAVLGGGALWFLNSGQNTAQGPVANPIMSAAVTPNPQTAVLSAVRGLVEVQAADGVWKAARAGDLLTVGQRLRTGALSSAALSFYDGSRAALGPSTEIALTAVDAQRTGKRVVQLTQISGESDHVVAKAANTESVYEVATPSGTGRARGTAFHVSVSLVVRFTVSEGAVAVTNLNVTVVVNAGETTLITGDEPPAPPVAFFSGAGEVQEIGEVWTIAGQTMLVDPGTLVEGGPQEGDWVSFEGRLLPGGVRVADRITLLHRAITNTFSFIGAVEAISDTTWTISGRTVAVVEGETEIEAGISAGAQVEVTGRIEADGTFLATEIRLFTGGSSAPFEFTGVVETMEADAWVISGLSVTVNVSATIDPGIVEGDVVHVTGVILEDGAWLAETIEKISETGAFDFVGIVISADPWNVSGVTFETDTETDIDDGLQTGNRVRVQGRVLPDGTWLAERIIQLDEGQRHAIQFTARVQSVDPWVVGGVTLTVDSRTKIEGDVEVGDLVTVKGNLSPDGAVLAKKITLVAEAGGCSTLIAAVTGVTSDTITLDDGQTITLTVDITVTGDIEVSSVVEIRLCVGEDGQLIVVSITVLVEPSEPTPTPEVTPTISAGEGEQVTICHIPPGNPGKAKTITVGAGAVPSHLAHGDTLGPCPPNPASPGKPGKP